jgi:hypothetical protein
MELMGHLNPSTLHHYVKHHPAYYAQAFDAVAATLIPDTRTWRGAI